MTDTTPDQPPHEYSLKGIALSRFTEAFGQSNLNYRGMDHQWSLTAAPFARDLYVVVHGEDNRPLVWFFDPNDRNDGASRSLIEGEDAILDIIDHIRGRIIKASRTLRKSADPRKQRQDRPPDVDGTDE